MFKTLAKIQALLQLCVVILHLVMLTRCVVNSAIYCNRHHIGHLPGTGAIFNLNFPFDYTEDETCNDDIYIPATNQELWQICFTLRRFRLGQLGSLCSDDHLEFNRSLRYCYNGSSGVDTDGIPTFIPRNDPMFNIFYNDLCFGLRQSSTTQLFRVQLFAFRRSAFVHGNWLGYYIDYEIKPGHPNVVRLPSLCNSSESTCDEFCFNGYVDVDYSREVYSSDVCVLSCKCFAPAVTAPCDFNQFTCFNRRCVPQTAACDGFDDCGDSSDEGYWHARCPGPQDIDACTFEVDSCALYGLNWSRHSTSYINPSWDNTYKTALVGHYMLAEYPSGSSAVLMYSNIKLPLNRSTDHCLSFWYFIGGGPVGSLLVYVQTRDDQDTSLIWRRDASTSIFGLSWFHGTVTLPAAAFPISELSFVAMNGILPTNRVAIDDVSLLPGNCTGVDDISCTFELSSCGWKSQYTSSVGFLWQRRHRNLGAPDHAAPNPAASSGNAYYIGCESSSIINADMQTAYLISPTVSQTSLGTGCLIFSYFVHFNREDRLTLHSVGTDGNLSLQWTLTGGNLTDWQTTSVQLSQFLGPIQIKFTAYMSQPVGIANHFGIDDVIFIPGYCPPSKTSSTSSETVSSTNPKYCATQTGKFRCRNGQCIDMSLMCDGKFDCMDSSDEGPGCHHPMTGGGLRSEYNSNPVIASSVGITLGIVFAITAAVLILFCLHRRRLLFFRQSGHRYNGGSARDYMDLGDFTGPSSLLPPSYNELLTRNFDAMTLPPPYVDKTEEDSPPEYGSLTSENTSPNGNGENSRSNEQV